MPLLEIAGLTVEFGTEAAPFLAMSPDFVYRNWKRLGGYKDTDHHIKFRMSDLQRHLQRKAKDGRP